jgi:hypothetical protein
MKVTVFWDAAPSSLLEVYRRFGSAALFYNQDDGDENGGSNHL